MYDTGIIVFCNVTKKLLKSNRKILILPFMRDPSTCECERVKGNMKMILEEEIEAKSNYVTTTGILVGESFRAKASV